MKKFLCTAIALTMLLALASCSGKTGLGNQASPNDAPSASPSSFADNSKEIAFHDKALEAGIRAALNKPDGAVTVGDALTLKALDISNKSFDAPDEAIVRDISDLAYFSNLEELLMGFNQITDITPISGLTNITSLDIGACQLTDLSPISGLIKMKVLTLSVGNNFSDLDALKGMTGLEQLDAKDVGLKDISALSGLTKLWELQLCGNEISDVAPISKLSGLKTLLLDGNPIADYGPLKDIYLLLEVKDFEIKKDESKYA